MKTHLKILILAALLVLPLLNTTAQDGPRYALVIGNAEYQNLTALKNPVNDAQDLAQALTRLGFTVEVLTNADLQTMERAVVNLSRNLSRDERAVGLFYYAGHGIQSEGINYLIPSQAEIAAEAFLKTKALASQIVLQQMQNAGNALNLVILDACRDNPYSWARGGTRGLTMIGSQPPGSIVVFATSAGSVAQDGSGRNGIFTAELLRNLEQNNSDLNRILDQTASAVQRVTRGAQVPAIYKQYFETFYFKSGAETAGAGADLTAANPSFGPVSVAKGSLLIQLDSPGTVTLLGQSVEVPAGGSLPVNDLAAGALDIRVRYSDGQVENRNVYINAGEKTTARFSHALPLSPPTDIYLYGLQDSGLYLDNRETMLLDQASGTNNYILRNQLSLGKHAIWWVNHTSLYAFIFELKSGVNRFSPRFTQYQLPELEQRFDFSEPGAPMTVTRDFRFKLFDADWNESEHTATVSITAQRDAAGLVTGELSVRHPFGSSRVPINLSLPKGDAYLRTEYTDFFADAHYTMRHRFYLTGTTLTVEFETFHPRTRR